MNAALFAAMVLSPALLLQPLAASVRDLAKHPDAWFKSEEALVKATNILSHQSDAGTWPKNLNTSESKFSGDPKSLKGTFDNGATTEELRFMAKIFQATKDPKYKQSFERGYDHILGAQYASGGWPQFYPPGTGYHRYITFNDDSMVRLMNFLRETSQSPVYAFLDAARVKKAQAAFEKGVSCIVKCQVKVDGKRTVWCAQHDEVTFEPRPARTFELVSLSGAESVSLLRLLMSLEQPNDAVIQAIESGVRYLESVKLTGFRVVQQKDDRAPRGLNKVVLPDASAPPLWARFYEIGTNKPLFVDRDGVPKYSIAEIGFERRNGYAWYGEWPKRLIETEFPAWRKKIEAK